ncbi:MAG: GntR family transcriptional regulator [Caldilineaceae bacterium]
MLSKKAVVALPAGGFRSKKDAITDALRTAITKGNFIPGQRLVIDDLAEQFGSSAIPVREALQQLQAEGLVTIQPYIGVTVTPIEEGLIVEIFELLEALELISGRSACRRMSKEEFAQLEVLLHEMDGLTSDLDAWSAANAQLHQFICDCAAMPLVKSTLNRVLDQWNRLRSYYLNDVFSHRVSTAQDEHWQMFKAMKARDEAWLERVIREHNRTANAAYSEHLQQALAQKANHS